MAGQQFCGEDWLKLKKKYHSFKEEDLLRYCFSSAYIVALLHDSLGVSFDDERYNLALSFCRLRSFNKRLFISNLIMSIHKIAHCVSSMCD